jgi:uncharacterized membrane protein
LLPVLLVAAAVVFTRERQKPGLLLICCLVVATEVRIVGIYSRGIWDDEAISLLETAGNALPSWPRKPTPAGVAKRFYEGVPPIKSVVEDLRRTDIHPPVYYVLLSLWRRLWGFSIETARMFSLLCSLASILGVYLLLQRGGARRPLLALFLYSIAASAVFFGSISRSYAFGTMLIVGAALAAFLATERAREGRIRTILALTAATAAGLALQTNYLTLFPCGVLLVWMAARLWRRFRILAVGSVLLAVLIGGVGWPVLLGQLSARPDQSVGFPGWRLEAMAIAQRNADLLWSPPLTTPLVSRGILSLLGILLLTSLYDLVRNRRSIDRGFWILVLGLAVAPSIGVAALDFIFDKRLSGDILYIGLAAPFLAILAIRGLGVGIDSRWRVTAIGAFGVVALLAAGNGPNWGYEDRPVATGRARRFARAVRETSSPGQIVFIDEGFGRTNPGAVVYELEPTTVIACFPVASQAHQAWSVIRSFSDIWVALSIETPPEARRNFLRRFVDSGAFEEVDQGDPEMYRFRRRGNGSCEAGRRRLVIASLTNR